MIYFLYKLRFDTAVHFGGPDSALSLYTSEETLPADTLFSALCHEALQQGGPAALAQLCGEVQQGKLRLSDTMPWHDETFYLPKPLLPASYTQEAPTPLRKEIKKLAWVPALELEPYMKSLRGKPWKPAGAMSHFGIHFEQTRVSLSGPEAPLPYQVGLFRFHQDCGLYFLCSCSDRKQADRLGRLLDGLGLTGIGGKVSSGCGKFHVEARFCLNDAKDSQSRALFRALSADRAPYLLLTASLPRDEELDDVLADGGVQLTRRGGFLASDQVDTPLKKRTQYFIPAGSVLQHTYQGALYDVGPVGTHPAYRYACPLFMGVTV